MSIETPTGELPSWIEISEEQARPKAVMVGVSDHATPLAKVEFKDGEIEFLSPKGEEGFSDDTLFKGKLVDGQLVGTTTSPNGVSWQWIGRRAPALKRKGAPKWGKPVTLFDGKDFTGWRFSDPSRAARWTVEGGTLVSNGRGPEIITTSKFDDFKLHLEFECAPKSNSGVYLRGRYEVQIETDSAEEPPSHHTGGVYGFLAPRPSCRVSPEYGKPSTSRSSDEPSPSCKMVKPSSITGRFRGSRVGPSTVTKDCRGPSTFKAVRKEG